MVSKVPVILETDPFVEVADTLHTTLLYLCCLTSSQLDQALSVRFQIIDNARIDNVGKSKSCMVSKSRVILCKQILERRAWPVLSGLGFDRAVCVQGSQTNIVVKYPLQLRSVSTYIIRNLETMHDLDLPTFYMRALRIIWKRTRNKCGDRVVLGRCEMTLLRVRGHIIGHARNNM
eukprot:COSAG05_NODE_488_length_9324_cov_10.796336_1_plen_176_part_00